MIRGIKIRRKARILIMYFSLSFCFCKLISCKEEKVVNTTIEMPTRKTMFDIKFSSGGKEEHLQIDDVIDSITTTRLAGIASISVSALGANTYRAHKDKFFILFKNQIYAFKENGEKMFSINANLSDQTSPKNISSFDIDKNGDIYIYDTKSFSIYKYDINGIYVDKIEIPDKENWYHQIFCIKDNQIVLSIQHKPDNEARGSREKTHVATLFDLTNHSYYPLFVEGGSQVRNMFLNLGSYKSADGFVFNYPYSRDVYKLEGKKLKKTTTIISDDFLPIDDVNKLDSYKYLESFDFMNKLSESGKVQWISYVYEKSDIYFYMFGFYSKNYWMFYNSKINEFKVISMGHSDPQKNMIITNENLIKSYIKNAKDGYLLGYLDGEEAREIDDELKNKYDPNSAYIIKIYPKYLNQEAWDN